MKSKGLFIFIGSFMAAAAVMYYRGVDPRIIMAFTGAAIIITGIAVLFMEMKWRRNSDTAAGKVTGYQEHFETGDSTASVLLYTMEVEYTTRDGKTLVSREQLNSSRRKYPLGTALKVRYSYEDPDLFIVEGDNSRIYAMIGIILFGIAVVALSCHMIRNNIQP